MSGDYCGFDGWPDCSTLASTGLDSGAAVVLVVVGIAALVLGVVLMSARKR